MSDILIILLVFLAIVIIFMQFLLLFRIKNKNSDTSKTDNYYENLKNIITMTGGRIIELSNRNTDISKERLTSLEEHIAYQSKMTEYRINELKSQLAVSLKNINDENSKQLDLMRQTVDEKLSQTLEKRLNQSFELVSERLEAVYKGIGEMHQIAGNVNDIKKVFSNVKLRGTWGELQLDNMLNQMLASNQYIKNCKIDKADSNDIVDFAIILPSKDSNVLLPIDSKFPLEEFNRYLSALDECNKDNILKAKKNLENVIKKQADSISKKYIIPPKTTDFAIMYFPIESLYAEALKIEGLIENLQTKKIVMCGPANLAALLTTLQTGFRTMAIEKHSNELWQLLSAFKHEFSRFADLLLLTQKKLQEAQDTIDDATKKTRKIERKLKDVSEITSEKSDDILNIID
jgi:DNA recombination protein RmuC